MLETRELGAADLSRPMPGFSSDHHARISQAVPACGQAFRLASESYAHAIQAGNSGRRQRAFQAMLDTLGSLRRALIEQEESLQALDREGATREAH